MNDTVIICLVALNVGWLALAVLGYLQLRAIERGARSASEDRRAIGDKLGQSISALQSGLQRTAADTSQVVGASAKELAKLGRELHAAVLLADGSFKALTDAMRDLENLQKMSAEVTRFTNEMTSASSKIQSQIELAGRVVGALHEVVRTWSEERAPLERTNEALAREVERALAVEQDERVELRKQLKALVLGLAAGRQHAGT